MEQLPGYDAWLESPYTNQSEPCEHDCSECEGEGTAWDEEKEVAIEDEPCPACGGGGKCDGDCEPDEPDYDDDDRGPEYDE